MVLMLERIHLRLPKLPHQLSWMPFSLWPVTYSLVVYELMRDHLHHQFLGNSRYKQMKLMAI